MRLPPHCYTTWYRRAPAWVRWLFDGQNDVRQDRLRVSKASARDLARWFKL